MNRRLGRHEQYTAYFYSNGISLKFRNYFV